MAESQIRYLLGVQLQNDNAFKEIVSNLKAIQALAREGAKFKVELESPGMERFREQLQSSIEKALGGVDPTRVAVRKAAGEPGGAAVDVAGLSTEIKNLKSTVAELSRVLQAGGRLTPGGPELGVTVMPEGGTSAAPMARLSARAQKRLRESQERANQLTEMDKLFSDAFNSMAAAYQKENAPITNVLDQARKVKEQLAAKAEQFKQFKSIASEFERGKKLIEQTLKDLEAAPTGATNMTPEGRMAGSTLFGNDFQALITRVRNELSRRSSGVVPASSSSAVGPAMQAVASGVGLKLDLSGLSAAITKAIAEGFASMPVPAGPPPIGDNPSFRPVPTSAAEVYNTAAKDPRALMVGQTVQNQARSRLAEKQLALATAKARNDQAMAARLQQEYEEMLVTINSPAEIVGMSRIQAGVLAQEVAKDPTSINARAAYNAQNVIAEIRKRAPKASGAADIAQEYMNKATLVLAPDDPRLASGIVPRKYIERLLKIDEQLKGLPVGRTDISAEEEAKIAKLEANRKIAQAEFDRAFNVGITRAGERGLAGGVDLLNKTPGFSTAEGIQLQRGLRADLEKLKELKTLVQPKEAQLGPAAGASKDLLELLSGPNAAGTAQGAYGVLGANYATLLRELLSRKIIPALEAMSGTGTGGVDQQTSDFLKAAQNEPILGNILNLQDPQSSLGSARQMLRWLRPYVSTSNLFRFSGSVPPPMTYETDTMPSRGGVGGILSPLKFEDFNETERQRFYNYFASGGKFYPQSAGRAQYVEKMLAKYNQQLSGPPGSMSQEARERLEQRVLQLQEETLLGGVYADPATFQPNQKRMFRYGMLTAGDPSLVPIARTGIPTLATSNLMSQSPLTEGLERLRLAVEKLTGIIAQGGGGGRGGGGGGPGVLASPSPGDDDSGIGVTPEALAAMTPKDRSRAIAAATILRNKVRAADAAGRNRIDRQAEARAEREREKRDRQAASMRFSQANLLNFTEDYVPLPGDIPSLATRFLAGNRSLAEVSASMMLTPSDSRRMEQLSRTADRRFEKQASDAYLLSLALQAQRANAGGPLAQRMFNKLNPELALADDYSSRFKQFAEMRNAYSFIETQGGLVERDEAALTGVNAELKALEDAAARGESALRKSNTVSSLVDKYTRMSQMRENETRTPPLQRVYGMYEDLSRLKKILTTAKTRVPRGRADGETAYSVAAKEANVGGTASFGGMTAELFKQLEANPQEFFRARYGETLTMLGASPEAAMRWSPEDLPRLQTAVNALVQRRKALTNARKAGGTSVGATSDLVSILVRLSELGAISQESLSFFPPELKEAINPTDPLYKRQVPLTDRVTAALSTYGGRGPNAKRSQFEQELSKYVMDVVDLKGAVPTREALDRVIKEIQTLTGVDPATSVDFRADALQAMQQLVLANPTIGPNAKASLLGKKATLEKLIAGYKGERGNLPVTPDGVAKLLGLSTDSEEVRGVFTEEGVDDQKLREALKNRISVVSKELVKSGQALVSSVKEPTNAFSAFGKMAEGVAGKVIQLWNYVAAGAVLYGTINAIRAMVTELAQLENQITRISGFFEGGDVTTRRTLTRQVLGNAVQFGVTAQESLAATNVFAQIGLSPQQTGALARESLAAQQGAGLSGQQATELLIAARNITGGEVGPRALLDRIARVEARYAVSAQDLSESIQRAGSLGQQLQPNLLGSLDAFGLVTGATTSVVERTRVTGNQAATALRFILSRLTAPEVGRALQDRFQINLAGRTPGELRPVSDILTDISTRYKSLTASGNTVEAAQLLTTVAGARQVNTAAALFQDWDKTMKVATESALARGDVERRLALQLDTVVSKQNQFAAALTRATSAIAERGGFSAFARGALSLGTGAANLVADNPALGVGSLVAGTAVGGWGLARMLAARPNLGTIGRGTLTALRSLGIPGMIAAVGAGVGYAGYTMSDNQERRVNGALPYDFGREDADLVARVREQSLNQTREVGRRFGIEPEQVISKSNQAIKALRANLGDSLFDTLFLQGDALTTKAASVKLGDQINNSLIKSFTEGPGAVQSIAQLESKSEQLNAIFELLRETVQATSVDMELFRVGVVQQINKAVSPALDKLNNIPASFFNFRDVDAALSSSLGGFQFNQFKTVGGSTLGALVDQLAPSRGLGQATVDVFNKQFLDGVSETQLAEFLNAFQEYATPSASGFGGGSFAKFTASARGKQFAGSTSLENVFNLERSLVASLASYIGNTGNQSRGSLEGDTTAVKQRIQQLVESAIVTASKQANRTFTTQETRDMTGLLTGVANRLFRPSTKADLPVSGAIAGARVEFAAPLYDYVIRQGDIAAMSRYRQYGLAYDPLQAQQDSLLQLDAGMRRYPVNLTRRLNEMYIQRRAAGEFGAAGVEYMPEGSTEIMALPFAQLQAAATGDAGKALQAQIKMNKGLLGMWENNLDKLFDEAFTSLPDQKQAITSLQDGLLQAIDKAISDPKISEETRTFLVSLFKLKTGRDLQRVIESETAKAIEATERRRAGMAQDQLAVQGMQIGANYNIGMYGSQLAPSLAAAGRLFTPDRMAILQSQQINFEYVQRLAVLKRENEAALSAFDQGPNSQNSAMRAELVQGQTLRLEDLSNNRAVQLSNAESQRQIAFQQRRFQESQNFVDGLTQPFRNVMWDFTAVQGRRGRTYEQILPQLYQGFNQLFVNKFFDALIGPQGLLGDKVRQAFENGGVLTQTAIVEGFRQGTAMVSFAFSGGPGGSRTGANQQYALNPAWQMGSDPSIPMWLPIAGEDSLPPSAVPLPNGMQPFAPMGPMSTDTPTGIAPIGKRWRQAVFQMSGLAGSYLGAWAGTRNRPADTNWAQEGSSFGSMLGSTISGAFFATNPLLGAGITIGTALLGGLIGGAQPKRRPTEAENLALETIARNTQMTVEAIENQTQLLSLDSRFLNVPTGFQVPAFRPFGAQLGGASVVIQVNGSDNPNAVAQKVLESLKQELGFKGQATDLRTTY